MIRRISMLSVSALMLATCAEEKLGRLVPKLTVTAFTGAREYAAIDVENRIIDLGEVPVYSTAKAIFELSNESRQVLTIDRVEYTETIGGDWLAPVFPKEVGPWSSEKLELTYSPAAVGTSDRVVATIYSNADEPEITVTVVATGVFAGAPDIELRYGTYVGPTAAECTDNDGDGLADVCRPSAPLDFRGVGLAAEGRQRLTLRNAATCDPFPGAPECSTCSLVMDKRAAAHNLGVGFRADTNLERRFAFTGSTATPFTLFQEDESPACASGFPNQVNLLVKFTAPSVEGVHEAVIVLESNDPDEPVIELSVRAQAVNAPMAVADFRRPDPVNPGAPATDPLDIEPLNRVYLDGSQSYDPRDPTNPALIATYQWEVISYPEGTDVGSFDWQNRNSARPSFYVPLAGPYEVYLRVTNVDGIESLDTEGAHLLFDVVPGNGIHVQLTWDDPDNDQDLHFTYQSQRDRICDRTYDCYYSNCTPGDFSPAQWFPSSPVMTGPNPSLDIDDIFGLGPENTNIDEPENGTYRVYVHYFSGHSAAQATRDTIRVYLNGLLWHEVSRSIGQYDVWAVVDIVWLNGIGDVVPYPSDVPGGAEPGSVANMGNSCGMGWDFP